MKLPRWLLLSLIAVSAVVLFAVPAWLWVEMPRWTAERFVAAVEAGDLDRATALAVDTVFVSAPSRATRSRNRTLNLAHLKIARGQRGLGDLLRGRQRIEFIVPDGREFPVRCVASWRNVQVDFAPLDALVAEVYQAELNARQRAATALKQRGAILAPSSGANTGP